MLCLHRLRARDVEVRALVTTVTEGTGLVSGQGVPEALLREQAAALGLELELVGLPEAPSNEIYMDRVGRALERLARAHDAQVAFGDLFLEDIRRWREDFLAGIGLEARFPLWGEDTGALLEEFLCAGFRAWITCVDTGFLPGRFAGRALEAQTVAEMGAGIDPCGENGEYHSFVWDGPGFERPVACRPGGTYCTGRSACCRLQGAGPAREL